MNEPNQEQGDDEAVYYSALASLDTLTHNDRVEVLLNWVKYVMLTEAADVMAEGTADLSPEFGKLCFEFATQVIGLPTRYRQRHGMEERCGKCPACIADGIGGDGKVSVIMLEGLDQLESFLDAMQADAVAAKDSN